MTNTFLLITSYHIKPQTLFNYLVVYLRTLHSWNLFSSDDITRSKLYFLSGLHISIFLVFAVTIMSLGLEAIFTSYRRNMLTNYILSVQRTKKYMALYTSCSVKICFSIIIQIIQLWLL